MPFSCLLSLRRAALAAAVVFVACLLSAFSVTRADDLPHAYQRTGIIQSDGERDVSVTLTRDGRQCLQTFDGLPGEQIIDMRSGVLVGAFPLGYPIAYAPDGRRAVCYVTGGRPGWNNESTTQVLCDFPSGKHQAALPVFSSGVAFQFTEDGRRVLCATEKRQTNDDRQANPGVVLETYDAATGRLLRSIFLAGSQNHQIGKDSLVFSASGRYMVFRGDFDGAWPGAIWATGDGHLVKEGTPSDADFRVESISDDGRYWITMGENPRFKMPENAFGEAARARRLTYRLWDARAGKQLHIFPGTDANFIDDRFPPRFTPDSRAIYWVGSGKGALEFWSIAARKPLRDIARSDETLIALSADRSTLVTENGYRTGQATVYDVATGKAQHVFEPPPGALDAVCWSPDGRYLATAGSGAVQLWDLRRACLARSVARNTGAFRYTLRFDAANRLTLTDDANAYAYRVPDLTPIGPAKGVPLPQPDYKGLHLLATSPFGESGVSIEDLIRAPDGKTMLLHLDRNNSADHAEEALVLDGTGKHILRKLTDPSSDLSQTWHFARYLPDSVHFALGASDGIRIFNVRSGARERTLSDTSSAATPPPVTFGRQPEPRPPFYAPFAVSPHSSLILGGLVSSDDRRLRIWRVSNGAIMQRLEIASNAVFSPDEKRLAEPGGETRLVDWRTGKATKLPTFTPFGTRTVSSDTSFTGNVAWSPDGTRFAVRGEEGIIVWRVPAGEGGSAHPASPVTLSFGGDSASAPDWAIQDAEGHYSTSPNGEKRLLYRPDGSDRLFPAAQFRARLRRPNLLRKTLANP